MTNYNDGEWHLFRNYIGGVHDKTIVECITEKGVKSRCEMMYAELEWFKLSTRFADSDGKPLAFRVVKEHKEPREWWLCESTYKPFTAKPPFGGFIHVREVIE